MKKSLALVLVLAMAFALAIPALATDNLPKAELTPVVEKMDNGHFLYKLEINAGCEASSALVILNFDREKLSDGGDGNVKQGSVLGTGLAVKNWKEDGLNIALSTFGMGTTDAGTLVELELEPVEGAEGDVVVTTSVGYVFWKDASTYLDFTLTKTDVTVALTEEVETTTPVVTDDENTTEPVTTEPTTENPDTTKSPDAPNTGAVSMVAVAAVSAIAGLGALGLRKKEN